MAAGVTQHLLQQAVDAVRAALGTIPPVAVITGSGMRLAADGHATLPYASIPGMPAPGVAGHAGHAHVTQVDGCGVLVFSGRPHLYEGHTVDAVSYPIRLLQALGVQHLVLTNAAGALHPLLLAGDVVLASDVIRPPAYLGITTSPLLDSTWRRATLAQGMARGLAMREGVYVQVLGPQYETRAEIAMYRRMGAHVIGMSTAVESGVATELGMRVQVLTLVTNRLTDVAAAQLSHDHVLDAAIAWQDRMTTGVTAAIFAACA